MLAKATRQLLSKRKVGWFGTATITLAVEMIIVLSRCWQARRLKHIWRKSLSPTQRRPGIGKYGNSSLLSVPFSRRLLTIWDIIDIEPEVGFGKRFGDMHAEQVWAAVYFRWIRFPWDNYLRTSIAVSAGLSYATQLPSGANHLLNDFSPEVTFAPPQYPQNEFVIRFQHRSTSGVGRTSDPGRQYITGGLRWRF